MVITPHVLVGAAIAERMSNNFWAVPLILLSHYVLDMVPHWDYLPEKFFLKSAMPRIILDLVIGFGLVWIFFGFSWWILLGTILGGLPDFPILLYVIFKNNKWLQKYYNFNCIVHFAGPPKPIWGILTQIAVIVIALWQ